MPRHLILDFSTRTMFGEQYRSLSSSLCSFLHSPVTSSLLDPNILIYTLFSNTLSLRTFLSVSDQVAHPYKTRGNILIFKFLNSNLEDKRFCSEILLNQISCVSLKKAVSEGRTDGRTASFSFMSFHSCKIRKILTSK